MHRFTHVDVHTHAPRCTWEHVHSPCTPTHADSKTTRRRRHAFFHCAHGLSWSFAYLRHFAQMRKQSRARTQRSCSGAQANSRTNNTGIQAQIHVSLFRFVCCAVTCCSFDARVSQIPMFLCAIEWTHTVRKHTRTHARARSTRPRAHAHRGRESQVH